MEKIDLPKCLADHKADLEAKIEAAPTEIDKIKEVRDSMRRLMDFYIKGHRLRCDSEVEEIAKNAIGWIELDCRIITGKIEVIDFLASLEKAKGAMDALMEGPDEGDIKKLFARAFKKLEEKVTRMLSEDEQRRLESPSNETNTDKYHGLKKSRDLINPQGIAFDVIRSSSSPERITPKTWKEIEESLISLEYADAIGGMPFDPKKESEMAKDYIRRLLEMTMSHMEAATDSRKDAREYDLAGIGRLIQSSFYLSENMIKRVFDSIITREEEEAPTAS